MRSVWDVCSLIVKSIWQTGGNSMTFPGVLLHERAREYYWEGQGNVSLKSFYAGRALYTLGQGYYAVDDTCYLLVNQDQPYTIAIEAEQPVESLCVFFEPGFLEDAQRGLVTPMKTLLDEPTWPIDRKLHFFERTHTRDQQIASALARLRLASSEHEFSSIDLAMAMYDLAVSLLQVHMNVYKEMEALPAARSATREELYHRLYLAREYMHAFFDRPLEITELATVATLSPTHFLRTFKQVFQQTPHQYLIGVRLEHAQHLLLHTDRQVTDICFSLGFESLGSFSWLFRQRLGCSPSAYRQAKR